MLTNANNTSFLDSPEHIFADGTFSYTPKCFLQMYMVHVYLNSFYVPIIYVFMDTKTQQSYRCLVKNKRVILNFTEKI